MQSPPDAAASPVVATQSLAERLRRRTQALHTEAERSGYVAEILHGRADQAGYALLLRNLLPAYVALEGRLSSACSSLALAGLRDPKLYRSAALEADLCALAGDGWSDDLAVLAAAARYAAAVNAAADDARLLAHAYVRYLGDLSGGQILARLLGRSLGLGPKALAFYAFPGVDIEALKDRIRAAIEIAGASPGADELLLAEAELAFKLNIAVSRAVLSAAAGR